ncbi:MAG: FimB/Mfa2 family fimbrial subunit [Dysgonomonas sp.]
MKLFHISLLLFLVYLFNACIGEDMDSCPEIMDNNLTLEFRYMDDKGADIFSDKIHQVDLFVFDHEGCFVTKQCIKQTSLSAFAGTQLSLQPGDYSIISWGNAIDKTMFSKVEDGCLMGESLVENNTLNENLVAINGDPLYYAPGATNRSLSQTFSVTVPERGSETATITFCRAHIKIEVYVKGFEDKSIQGELLPPVIELTDIPANYDFEMHTCGSSISYRDVSSYCTIEGEELAAIEFYTPLLGEDFPTQLLVAKSSDGSTVTTINLDEFVKENNIVIGDTGEAVIPILIEYKQASFVISLPGWGKTPIGPEL